MDSTSGSRAPRVAPGGTAAGHHARIEALAAEHVAHGTQRTSAEIGVLLGRVTAFSLGGLAVVSLTDGVGSLADLSQWWAEPVVFQKLVVWTLLWHLLGLGRGVAASGLGALPPVAGLSYWLTPGTMRLAPWPGRVPFTRGSGRTVVDVVLYAVVLALASGLLGLTGAAGGTLPVAGVAALLAALALLGLRDRTPVLAARPEVTVLLLIVFLLPAGDVVIGAKLALVTLGWVVAALCAHRHLPFALASTVADAPWLRSSALRRRLWQRDDHDVLPADAVRRLAASTVGLGFVLPALLLLARGGTLTTVAVTLAVLVQLAVASTLPRDLPLETSAFLLFATVLLFGHHAGAGFGSVPDVVPVALLSVGLAVLAGFAVLAPERTTALSPLRHAAASGPASLWLFRADALDRFDVPVQPDARTAERLHYGDLARHALHPDGRTLDALVHRALDAGSDVADYRPRPAGFVAGAALGWAVGTSHRADAQLLAAIQERCGFAPGELRVITLEAHAMPRTERRYRVLDAASGLVEHGTVDVDDMIDRVPWFDPAAPAIPVEVQFSVDGFTGYTAPERYRVLADTPEVRRPRPAPRLVPPRPRPRPAPVTAVTARPAPSPVVVLPARPLPTTDEPHRPRHARPGTA